VVIADQQIPVLFVQAFQTFDIPLQPGSGAADRQPFAPAVHHEITKCGTARHTEEQAAAV
jgi:hypothetical protein